VSKNMHIRTVALAALVIAIGVATAPLAGAQGREFAGTVVSVSGNSIEVEDRRGDRGRFARSEGTTVEGKPGWSAIAAGDRVIVKWSLSDGPRHARRVIVLGSGPRR
jgi:hypothetical protein